MKVIVVGAGVLGASVSYQLAKRGVQVALVDKGVPGQAASAASFSWINSATKEPQGLHNLNAISISEWQAVARELGSSDWLHLVGNVHVANSPDDAERLLQQIDGRNSYGYAAIPYLPKDLSRLDPRIRVLDTYELAAFFPGEGYISMPRLIHELLEASRDLGATVLSLTAVSQFIQDDARVRGVVLENGERLEADLVVVAAGAGIGPLMSQVGLDVQTAGTPGVALTTSPGASGLSTVLHLPMLSVRPDTGGRLVLRSSEADGQIDPETWNLPEAAVRGLIEQAADALNDLDPRLVSGERIRVAARPYPLDGKPFVGNWDGVQGLYVMTMHSGVTQAALMGRLVADEITTGHAAVLLEEYRPSRKITADEAAAFDHLEFEGEKSGSAER